jgi:hypothetical protein
VADPADAYAGGPASVTLFLFAGDFQRPGLAASSRVGPQGRDYLLSVSVLRQGTKHPLLCASADDSEARSGGKPISLRNERALFAMSGVSPSSTTVAAGACGVLANVRDPSDLSVPIRVPTSDRVANRTGGSRVQAKATGPISSSSWET